LGVYEASRSPRPHFPHRSRPDASRVCVLGAQVFLEAYAAEGVSHDVAEEVLEYFTIDQMTKELSYAAGAFILFKRTCPPARRSRQT